MEIPVTTTRQSRWITIALRVHHLPERLKAGICLALVVAAWGWVDVRRRGVVDPNDPGLHKTDFTVYTEAGAAFFDGRPPYEVTNPRGWGYLYPPPFAMLVAPLHSLRPETQVLVWFAVSCLAAWGCYTECVRIARAVAPQLEGHGPFGPVPVRIGAAAVVAALLPALNCLQRGQVGTVQLYLLLLGLRLFVERASVGRAFLAGAVLALPIVLKVTPIVPVGFLIGSQLVAALADGWRSDTMRRTGACSCGIAIGLVGTLLVAPACLVGWQANLNHLGTWWHDVALKVEESTGDEFAGDSYSARNQSLANAVHRAGNWAHFTLASGPNDEGLPGRAPGDGLLMDTPAVDATLAALRALAGCLLLFACYRVGRSQDAAALTAGFGLAGVATLVMAPIARAHYFVLLLPAVMFTSFWLLQQGRARAAWIAAVLPTAFSVAHYVAINPLGRMGLLGIGIAVWYASFCLVLGRGAARATVAEPTIFSIDDFRTSEPLRRAA